MEPCTYETNLGTVPEISLDADGSVLGTLADIFLHGLVVHYKRDLEDSEGGREMVAFESPCELERLTLEKKIYTDYEWKVVWSERDPSSWDWDSHEPESLRNYIERAGTARLLRSGKDGKSKALLAFGPTENQDPSNGAQPRWDVIVSLMQPEDQPDGTQSYVSIGSTVILSFQGHGNTSLNTPNIIAAVTDTMVAAAKEMPPDLAEAFDNTWRAAESAGEGEGDP